MGLFIIVYLTAVALAALTVGWAASLAKKSGQRLFRSFFYFVVVNDLVALLDILFRYLPSRVGSPAGGVGSMVAGFLVFPLMAAFSVLVIDFMLALDGRPFPGPLKKICAGYWGLLFLGFLVAEFRQIVDGDFGLTKQLMPFFDGAIFLSGLGSAAFAFIRSRAAADLRERRFVRVLSLYYLAVFLVFAALFFGLVRFGSGRSVLVRSLLGLAYLLIPLALLRARLAETGDAPLTRLADAGRALDRWLEAGSLSPREREIAARVLAGKSNRDIEKELFIGRRTVESHLYSIYRKLGVKNRLQLARLAAAETDPPDR